MSSLFYVRYFGLTACNMLIGVIDLLPTYILGILGKYENFRDPI
jgi:hypothetical protein